MSFQPSDFLEISKEISGLAITNTPINSVSKKGAWLRTIVGRSYYSAFITLRERLEKSSYPILIRHNAEDHGEIIKALSKNLPRTLQIYSNDLKTLHSNRTNADYDLNPTPPIDEGLATTAIEQAGGIIKNAKTIVNSMLTET